MELEDLSQELKKGQAGQTILWRSGLVFIFFQSVCAAFGICFGDTNRLGFPGLPWVPSGEGGSFGQIPLLASTCEHVTLNSISALLFVCMFVFLQVIVWPSSLVLLEKLMSSARLADTICHLPSSSVPRPPMMGTSAGSTSTMLTSATSQCPGPSHGTWDLFPAVFWCSFF